MSYGSKSSWIYGVHPVLRLLGSQPEQVTVLWLASGRIGKPLQQALELAGNFGVSVERVSPRAFARRLGGMVNHQGIAAAVRLTAARGFSELQQVLAKSSAPRTVLVLDRLQDPHNLGACLRVAAATAVCGVLVPVRGSAKLTPAVLRVAAGAPVENLLFQSARWSEDLETLKCQGFRLIAAQASASSTVYEQDLSGDLLLALGGEQGFGLRTLRLSDAQVRLPMQAGVESLNVAVASGVLLYEAVRQRRALQ